MGAYDHDHQGVEMTDPTPTTATGLHTFEGLTRFESEAEREAYALGREHALNAATWTLDGNTPRETIVRLAKMLDDGDPQVWDFLPHRPDLSGEWADSPTPQSLFAAFIGEPSHGNADDDQLMDGLAAAYEKGVDETFETACEAHIRTALAPPETEAPEVPDALEPDQPDSWYDPETKAWVK